EAGLPRDPEWRAAFVAYLEWGSRLAVENSQPGARPPAHMPVPRWWWVCDATPGSRVSALAPPNDEMATFRSSSPAPAKPVPMPAHHRVGLDEHQRRAPVAPDSSESHPKKSVARPEAASRRSW
ncbi:MAG TPA: hypothetical protein VKE51_41800, partial [Vicinamibacterales bacterium]|nr:hypothetical protein [Vicinamibacterales bacterium]